MAISSKKTYAELIAGQIIANLCDYLDADMTEEENAEAHKIVFKIIERETIMHDVPAKG